MAKQMVRMEKKRKERTEEIDLRDGEGRGEKGREWRKNITWGGKIHQWRHGGKNSQHGENGRGKKKQRK